MKKFLLFSRCSLNCQCDNPDSIFIKIKFIHAIFLDFTDFYNCQRFMNTHQQCPDLEQFPDLERNKVKCPRCPKTYNHHTNMLRHYKYECGQPARFKCPYCQTRYRQRYFIWSHIRNNHSQWELYCVDTITGTILRKGQATE